ncbi:MAG: hypothetical protein ACKVVP_07875, partial [Chloroflexota bacterium]
MQLPVPVYQPGAPDARPWREHTGGAGQAPRPAAKEGGTHPNAALHGGDTHLYDSEQVDRWLKRWAELQSLAEYLPSSSRWDVGRPQPTRGRAGDGRSFAGLRADIEAALDSLPSDSLGRRVLVMRRDTGSSLGTIARLLHVRKDDVCAAHRD